MFIVYHFVGSMYKEFGPSLIYVYRSLSESLTRYQQLFIWPGIDVYCGSSD